MIGSKTMFMFKMWENSNSSRKLNKNAESYLFDSTNLRKKDILKQTYFMWRHL